jgi:acetyl esterase
MPVDPCFEALLSDRRSELRPPPPHLSLEAFRAANRSWLIQAPSVPLRGIDNVTVAGMSGALSLRIYRPRAEVTPLILYCHGGGFVLGDLDTHDSICSRLAHHSGAAVVSVAYRLAPEYSFPQPSDDCYAALMAMRSQAAALGLDGSRLAIAGDSAGAQVALAALLTARADALDVRYAALLYPMVDPTCGSASAGEFGRGYLLSHAVMRWFWQQYLPTPTTEDARARLLQAELAGLPPLSISTAECDPLRDEGEALMRRARSAGVPVRYRCYTGMVHGFAGLPQLTPVADTAIRELATDLRAALEA